MTSKSESVELLPCPWCDSDDTTIWGERRMFSRVAKYRMCNDCGAQGPNIYMNTDETVEEAEARADEFWNTRTQEKKG